MSQFGKFARLWRGRAEPDREVNRESDNRAWFEKGGKAVAPGAAYGRGTTRTTAPMRAHALAGGKCVWTARMRCPGGANRRWGGGESTRTTAPSSCEAAAHVRFTTYEVRRRQTESAHVRCTIAKFVRAARDAERMRFPEGENCRRFRAAAYLRFIERAFSLLMNFSQMPLNWSLAP